MKRLFSLCLAGLFLSSPLYSDYLQENETSIRKYLKPVELVNSSSNIDTIDCIYVVNLDERPERWDRAAKIFDQYNIKANRFSAINGWKLSEESKKELSGSYPLLRGGTYGCLLSHVSIMQDAYDRGYNLVWIMEDDIEFVDNPQKLPYLLSKLTVLDPDWDIFYTDSFQVRHPKHKVSVLARPDQKIEDISYYQKKFSTKGTFMPVRARRETHSWIFSRKGLQKVLHHFTHAYLYRAIDWDVHTIPGIRQYSPTKDVVTKFRGLGSDTLGTSELNPDKITQE